MTMLSENLGGFPDRMLPSERIRWAGVALMREALFQGLLLKNLKVLSTLRIDTAATDGQRLLYNPHFILTLDPQELVFLLYHEVGHVERQHHLRRGDYPHDIYNEAGDYVINLAARADGFKFFDGVLYDAQYTNWSTSQIADVLLQKQRDEQEDDRNPDDADQTGEQGDQPDKGAGGSGGDEGPDQEQGEAPEDGSGEPEAADGGGDTPKDGSEADGQADEGGNGSEWCDKHDGAGHIPEEARSGNGTTGGVFDMTGENGLPLSDADRANEEAKATANLVAAAMAAAAAGEITETTRQLIADIQRVEADWREALRDFVDDQVVPTSPTFQRQNRQRQVPTLIMPGAKREMVGKIVVFKDESASVPVSSIRLFFDHLTTISEDVNPEEIVIVPFTHLVNPELIRRYEAGEDIDAERTMSGGTDPGKAFQWLADNWDDEEPIAGVIVLTDMEFNWSFDHLLPDCPVLWGSTDTRADSMNNAAKPDHWGDLLVITQ